MLQGPTISEAQHEETLKTGVRQCDLRDLESAHGEEGNTLPQGGDADADRLQLGPPTPSHGPLDQVEIARPYGRQLP